MKPGSCLQQMQMSSQGRGAHVVEKAGVTMGSTGSRNLWPRKGSRACGMCRARVSGFQEDLGICLQVLESASKSGNLPLRERSLARNGSRGIALVRAECSVTNRLKGFSLLVGYTRQDNMPINQK